MASDPVTVVIRFQAQPGKHEATRSQLAALVTTVLAQEPACLGITMYQDPAEPTRFLLHERWVDREAYLGPHMQTPHLQQFISQSPALLTGPPEITFWREVRLESALGKP